eukprot:scaffold33374_cov47-Cyclotella_meneghiniana.AAC.1
MKLLASLALLTAATASSPGGGGGYYRGGYPQQYDPNYHPQQGQQQAQLHQQHQGVQTSAVQQSYGLKQDAPAEIAAEAAAVSELPSPWQEHMDPSSGRPYYYNPESGVTQWERPEGETKDAGAVVDTAEVDGTQTNTDGGDSEVAMEANVTSDLDPFSNAFAQQQRNDEQDNASNTDKQQQVAPELSVQDGQTRDNTFDMGSNGQNQGYNNMQPYGKSGQGQNWNQQGQQQQHQQGGDQTSGWGQQLPPQQSEKDAERREYSNHEGQLGQNWNNQQGGQQPPQQQQDSQTSTWGQQQASEEKKEPEQPAQNELIGRQLSPQQGQPPNNWNQQPPGGQSPGWGAGSAPGWQTQGNAQQPPPQQQLRQPPQQQGHPQWQRQPDNQRSPPGMMNQPPPGYPMRPGYGMPPHNMQHQQQHPNMQYQQPPQRGPPPGYNGYPPQQYPYGPPQGMNMNTQGPGGGQLVTQRTEELSSAVREKWSQALSGLGSFGNRTKELAENAKNQIGESA